MGTRVRVLFILLIRSKLLNATSGKPVDVNRPASHKGRRSSFYLAPSIRPVIAAFSKISPSAQDLENANCVTKANAAADLRHQVLDETRVIAVKLVRQVVAVDREDVRDVLFPDRV